MADYRVRNHRIEMKDPNDELFHDFCEEFRITKVIIDLFSQKKNVEIVIYDTPNPIPFVLPRRALNRTILPELLDRGLTVVDTTFQVELIIEILLDSELTADRVYQHRCLGFRYLHGQQIFLAHHPIGISDPITAASEYIESAQTKPSGTLDSWRGLKQREVIGRVNMELALCLSVTAPVAHLLRESKIIPLIPLWALIGQSSTGKTTALKLMASIWGSPEESAGLVTDLNATLNGFFAQLGQAYGMPSLIDETSCVPEWDFTKVVYNLPKGRDKTRCNTDGTVRDHVHYSGAIVLTGETSLFNQTSGTQGLLARLVEFSLCWTDDEAHAQRLEYGCRRNYGTAVYPLITWLLNNQSVLSKVFTWHYDSIKDELGIVSGVEDRLIKMYAIICTAGTVIRSALKLTINTVNLKRLLIQLHRDNERLNSTPDLIFERLKLLILKHNDRFPTDIASPKAHQLWGEHDIINGQGFVWIIEDIFDDFLKQAGARNPEKVKSELAENGWLIKTADRHYRTPHNVGGVRTKCYRLVVDTSNPLPALTSKPTKRPKKAPSKNWHSLLDMNDDD